MTVYELEKIPDEEIERLLDCEYNNTLYERQTLVVDTELEKRYLQAEKMFLDIEAQAKAAQNTRDTLRAEMLSLMEKQHILSWESRDGQLKVTYVAPQDRITVDSKKLKTEYPQVYSECQKLSKIKAQIRVTIRGGEEE